MARPRASIKAGIARASLPWAMRLINEWLRQGNLYGTTRIRRREYITYLGNDHPLRNFRESYFMGARGFLG